MIRINLLSGERKVARKKIALFAGQRLAIGCGGIMLASLGVIGWRYLALDRQSKQLDADIAASQLEATRLHSIIEQVQQFEQRKAQLQQRVTLIEQLRRDQIGPVHMLDEISRALPPMLWLTDMKQAPNSNEVLIDGRATAMTGLSDFVGNLEASGYFQRSIEIVSSVTETVQTAPGELIKFQIKAIFQAPQRSAAATPAVNASEVKPRS
jgi:type IV pilus assembly protein PilN